jgi:hypothetical protein
MMRCGELWELTMPVLRIEGKGFGSSHTYPTPVCYNATPGGPRNHYKGLGWQAKHGYKANTPSGSWPTPTCSDAYTDKLRSTQQKEGSMRSVTLSRAVKMWPTPDASGFWAKDVPKMLARRERVKATSKNGNGFGLTIGQAIAIEENGGQLNPTWVEWLMGWPLLWTSMEPMKARKFLAWQRAFQSGQTASKPSATVNAQQL